MVIPLMTSREILPSLYEHFVVAKVQLLINGGGALSRRRLSSSFRYFHENDSVGEIKMSKVEETFNNGPSPFPTVFFAFDARMIAG